MTNRFTNLDRTLTLVRALCESVEGLSLDQMADLLGVNRRTAERMRDVILIHFDLEEIVEGRNKRFRIRDSLSRAYTCPTAPELAALETIVQVGKRDSGAQAELLDRLLGKLKASLDATARRRIDTDLDLLTRLQRSRVVAGPQVICAPANLTAIQGAILAGLCVEFDYLAEGADGPSWRRVVPYGLIHGPITYLVGQLPRRNEPPATYRLDRMSNVRASGHRACAPESWDLDAWLDRNFGMWDEPGHDIVLRVRVGAVAQARAWRFHPGQVLEDDGDELIVRFHAGGLQEIADHLFTWGGDVVIESPQKLRDVLRERIAAAGRALG